VLPRSLVRTAALALIAAAGARALAAPLPPLLPARPHPSVLTPLRTSASAALDRACGTDLAALPSAYADAVVQRAASPITPQPTPHSTDVGEIAVLEDDGTFFFTDKDGHVNLDVAAVGRAFYRTHGDDYDQVATWLTTGLSNWLGSPTALASEWYVHNDVAGLGLMVGNFNSQLGLPPHVQAVLTMNGLQRYPDDPAADVPGLPNYVTQDVLAHEFGHEWLAYVDVQTPSGPSTALLGRAFQHWSFFFDSDGSVMEGPDWVQQGADTFSSLPPIARYGPLDQYLMGVRARGEVDSLTVLSDADTFVPPGPYVTMSDPNASLTARGPFARYAIDDVEAANGPRVPDAAHSPHALRVAFALVVPRGSDATSADLTKLEGIRNAFPGTVQAYTGGRLSVDVSLDSRVGTLRLDHVALGDIESSPAPRPVTLHVNVDQAGIPIGVDPSGTTLQWRVQPSPTWNVVPMSALGGDAFTASLPPTASGEVIEYRFHAKADAPGVEADLPAAGHAPFSYRTGPDVTPPVVTHWSLPTQALERMPQPLLARVHDNSGPGGLDQVWAEVSVDGGPIQTVAATSAGGDSFVVAVGAGVPRGSAIAYRIAARDKAAAANVGYSNAGFDTLRVGYDQLDGFWGPSPWTHAIVRFNRRDEWHAVDRDAFPAGSGAWHCGLEGIPYGPYQDGALWSPAVAGITSGCYLSFIHRFDFENGPGAAAFDGARVEIQVGNGAWQVATPVAGYTHAMAESDQGFEQGSPCWSGRRDDWHEDRIDLSPYAPGPIRVRFRVSTDVFVGEGGWWLDQIQFHFPQQPTTGVGPPVPSLALGACWPNPASQALRQALRLPQTSHVDWALYDLAGRRVAALHDGVLGAGPHELEASLPRALAGGLYFARVRVDGRILGTSRVAIVR
jgi:hypothetical protein